MWTCQVCGDSETAMQCADPYEEHVNKKEVIVVLCADCFDELCEDFFEGRRLDT